MGPVDPFVAVVLVVVVGGTILWRFFDTWHCARETRKSSAEAVGLLRKIAKKREAE